MYSRARYKIKSTVSPRVYAKAERALEGSWVFFFTNGGNDSAKMSPETWLKCLAQSGQPACSRRLSLAYSSVLLRRCIQSPSTDPVPYPFQFQLMSLWFRLYMLLCQARACVRSCLVRWIEWVDVFWVYVFWFRGGGFKSRMVGGVGGVCVSVCVSHF